MYVGCDLPTGVPVLSQQGDCLWCTSSDSGPEEVVHDVVCTIINSAC